MMVACAHTPEEMGGVPVTPEMLESVSRSISEQNATEPIGESEIPSSKTALQSSSSQEPFSQVSENSIMPDTVYWTENGTVYHLDDRCSTLRRSEHILQGSIEDALLAKKERACKSCS